MSEVRKPRAIVRVNGQPVAGWINWSVTSNEYYEADTFRVSFAMSALPKVDPNAWGAIDRASVIDANWFSRQKEIFLEVFAGFPSDPDHIDLSELQVQIYGRVDNIEIVMEQGVLTLTGRDLTGAFIDAHLTAEYVNTTASEIATQLARSRGLTPVVTATRNFVGTYYKRDQVKLSVDGSEWDLLTRLARDAGFVVYVRGNELHFEEGTRSLDDPYVVSWDPPTTGRAWPISNAAGIRFMRAMTVAKGATVQVTSASLTSKAPVTAVYPSAPKAIQPGKASPFGDVQPYFFKMPAGRTHEDAERYALKQYEQILSHEMKVELRLPGDATLTTRDVILMQGTGTAFDQIFYPREIVREMSAGGGFEMTVSAQNANPETVASAAPELVATS
jgi:hypothetical protein